MSEFGERRVNDISGRDFGRLEAEVLLLKAQNVELKEDIKDLQKDMKLLVAAITEAKGGWKVLLAVGTASAAMASGITKLLIWLKGG